MAFLAILVLLFSFVFRGEAFRETFRYSLQGVALVPVFVCAIRFPRWGLMKVLNLRPVASGTGNDRNLHTRSPAIPSASRLVATTQSC